MERDARSVVSVSVTRVLETVTCQALVRLRAGLSRRLQNTRTTCKRNPSERRNATKTAPHTHARSTHEKTHRDEGTSAREHSTHPVRPSRARLARARARRGHHDALAAPIRAALSYRPSYLCVSPPVPAPAAPLALPHHRHLTGAACAPRAWLRAAPAHSALTGSVEVESVT